MNDTESLVADPLFVGVTRPAMKWGVPYTALLANLVVTMEIFLLSRNLLTLLLGIPFHGVCGLLCTREPRWFELVGLWARTKGQPRLLQGRRWRAASYSALALGGRGRSCPPVRC